MPGKSNSFNSLSSQASYLSDSNEVWSDKVVRSKNNERIELYMLVDCESDHNVRLIIVWSDIMEDQ